MIKKHISFTIITTFLLTGCVAYENHGHYKIEEKKLVKNLKKDEVLDLFGAPLKITNNENIFYYMYSQIKKTSFGSMKEIESKIIRIEFKNNVVEKFEIFSFKDYDANETRTQEPDMELHLFSEIINSIGYVAGTDSIKENEKNFKSSEKSVSSDEKSTK